VAHTNHQEKARVLIAGFPAGPWGTNCYVVATGPGQECVVIDPGKDAAAGVADVVREHT
jgi:hydroxyacylglutathione hydrolase